MATVTSGTLTVPLVKIHLPVNGRDRDLQHVAALAGSISRQGLLSPLTVTPASPTAAAQGYDYDLVAAFHRYVAVCQFGHAAIDVVLPPPLRRRVPSPWPAPNWSHASSRSSQCAPCGLS